MRQRVGAAPQCMVQQWHQERAGTTITLLAPNIGRVRQPVHDRWNVACSSSAQHLRSHWWPCRQQLGRHRNVPHHLLNHAIRRRSICRDGCPAHRTRVRSLGRSDEAVPVHDVSAWLRSRAPDIEATSEGGIRRRANPSQRLNIRMLRTSRSRAPDDGLRQVEASMVSLDELAVANECRCCPIRRAQDEPVVGDADQSSLYS